MQKGRSRLRKAFCLAIICLAPLAKAEARPRDEAMSGAYRCEVIPDSRQWLDCYYGAAQAQRHALGLSPVTSLQLRLASAPSGQGTVMNGETRTEVMLSASRCYDIQDDRQWLNCYYNAAGPMRAALGLMSQQFPTDYVALPASHVPSPRANFAKIVSRMEAFSFDHSRNFTVTLSNGQVWRQVAGDTNYAHWNKAASDYVAIISHGAFGSTNFQIQGSGEVFKVKRLQ